VVLAVLSPFTGGSRRWLRVGVAALVAAGIIATVARVMDADTRVWLGNFYLIGGYWLPALMVARAPHRFEAWLRRVDSRIARVIKVRAPLGELAYLCCYPLVPAAFLVNYMNGSIAEVSRYWTAVFAAGFACYGSLPWLVSRPPRVVEENQDASASAIRRLNIKVLARLSHGWNTFPSGHVAVAFAAALSTIAVMPSAGIVFAFIAAGIAIGSIIGRYHYSVDAVAGVVVGVGGWAISTVLVP
jgi:membrane-associated phospholipid phosphatase